MYYVQSDSPKSMLLRLSDCINAYISWNNRLCMSNIYFSVSFLQVKYYSKTKFSKL